MSKKRKKAPHCSGAKVTEEGTYVVLGRYLIGPMGAEPEAIFRQELHDWTMGNRPASWLPERCATAPTPPPLTRASEKPQRPGHPILAELREKLTKTTPSDTAADT